MYQIKKIKTIILGLMFFSLFSSSVVASDNLNPDTIIAIVNEIPIKYRDIQVHKDIIKFDPVLSQLEREDLQVELLKIEKQRLLFQIEKIIIDKAMNRFNITVSEEEIDRDFHSKVEMVNLSEQDIENIKNAGKRLVEALELWQKNPTQEKKIYEDKLSDMITYEGWEGYKNLYNTPEKLEEVKKLIPSSLEDIKDISREGIIKELKLRKLKDRIAEEVKVENKEIKEYYTKKYPEVISWTIYHFFHRKKDVLEKIKKDIQNKKDIKEIIECYDLLRSKEGGYEEEVYFPEMYTFYTEELPKLSRLETSSIVQGPFYIHWSVRQMPSRFQENKDEIFYHFIQVIDIDKGKEIPKFEDIRVSLKEELLAKKKEKVWQEWLKRQIEKANIKILDERYKDFMDLLETPQEMELSGGDLQESKPQQEKSTPQPSTPEDKDITQAKEGTTKEPKPEEQPPKETNHSTLHLKDGRTITGIITKEDPNTIKINTGVIEYTISKDEIDRIE